MPQAIVREVSGDEMLDAMYWIPSYSFRTSPPLADKAERRERLRSRGASTYVAAFVHGEEDGKAVACAGATAMTQQVRGARFAMAAIHNVATHPAARRRGHARRVLAQLLDIARRDGQAMSCLYPFNETFYERLGYVSFPQPRLAKLTPAALQPLAKKDAGGRVDLMLLSEGYDAFRAFMVRLQARTHGLALVDEPERVDPERNDAWLALARVNNETVGIMLYDLRGDSWGEFLMRAPRFYYLTSQGRALLLTWIARHAGQANRVELTLAPAEQPNTWLTDLGLAIESAPGHTPMGRVLDVAAIGGMVAGEGRFTAHVSDALCPWNEGVWQFAASGGLLSVTRSHSPECTLSINGLSALIYGVNDPGDFALREWGDPPPCTQDTMRAMFPPALPYLHEPF